MYRIDLLHQSININEVQLLCTLEWLSLACIYNRMLTSKCH